VETRTSSSSTDTRIPLTRLDSGPLPVVDVVSAFVVTKTVSDIEQLPSRTNKCQLLTGVGFQ
jgi:hypothetical protein